MIIRTFLGLHRLDVCRQSDAAPRSILAGRAFVNLLRIPYAYLYPLIIMFCVIGVTKSPIDRRCVDHADHGRGRLCVKKFSFDPAPGARLVIARFWR